MASGVRFIHAADLHLGATFKGLTAASADKGTRFIDAISHAYQKIINLSIGQQVEFLILAGDTFNTGEVSYRVQREFFDGLYRLQDAGIAVYLCTGNHDPLATWSARLPILPANVHVFPSAEPGYFMHQCSNGTRVGLAGHSYETQSELCDLTQGVDKQTMRERFGKVDFFVGVMHSAINDPDYAPCSLRSLQKARLDYWALGHIHERSYIDHVNAFFPGSPQGLDINETSQHGCFLVELKEGGRLEQQFIETASIVWEKPVIDVAELQSTEDLFETLAACGNRLLALHRAPVCARVTVKGRTALHSFFASQEDVRDLCRAVEKRCSVGELWLSLDDIVDKTAAIFDLDKIKQENLFPTVILNEARTLEKDPEKARALLAREFAEVGIVDLLDDINLKEAARKARNRCLDLLVGGMRS